MSSLSLSILTALLIAVAPPVDPIDKVVADSSANPFFGNGLMPIINLPENASTDEIVAKTLKMRGYAKRVKGYKITEFKRVRIDLPYPYTAVLIKSNEGENVVLLRYEGPRVGWWNLVVNIE